MDSMHFGHHVSDQSPHGTASVRQTLRVCNSHLDFIATPCRTRNRYPVLALCESSARCARASNRVECWQLAAADWYRFKRRFRGGAMALAPRHDPALLDTYSRLLLDRGVEGLITVDTLFVVCCPCRQFLSPGTDSSNLSRMSCRFTGEVLLLELGLPASADFCAAMRDWLSAGRTGSCCSGSTVRWNFVKITCFVHFLPAEL